MKVYEYDFKNSTCLNEITYTLKPCACFLKRHKTIEYSKSALKEVPTTVYQLT